ncbi:MAG: S1 family peptidase [Firmicutes bacterium]|nr:S1 family peptidase [Bacillota bacterium]
MKKIIAVIMVFAVMFTLLNLTSVSAMNDKTESNLLEKQNEQAYKFKMFNDMMNEEKNNVSFNEIYGGVYFEDTTLFINVVEHNVERFKNNYNLGVEYEVKNVIYSLKKLEEVKEIVLQNIADLKIREISVDIIKNKVVILSELPISEFKNKLSNDIDFDTLEVKTLIPEIDYNVKYTVNGHAYVIRQSQCTVGFAAKDSNGNPGFVTAGHCVVLSGSTTGTDVYYDGYHAGDVASGWHFEDGDVDGAFIKLRDPWIGTTWLPSRSLIFGGSYYTVGTFSSYYAIGTSVSFHGTFAADGGINTAVENGQITGNGITIIDDNYNVLYVDMFSTDIETHHGDSGGPLTLTFYIGEGYYETNVIGVLSLGIDGNSYFSKAINILSELNLSVY